MDEDDVEDAIRLRLEPERERERGGAIGGDRERWQKTQIGWGRVKRRKFRRD